MTWTILRPVAFFDNLIPGFVGKIFATSIMMTLKKDQKLQFIASSDVGWFAAQAFIHPERYRNRRISLAGDELTSDEFKAEFEKTTGQNLPGTYWFLTRLLHRFVKEFGLMFRWFRDEGFGADVAELRRVNPELKSFGMWLREESQYETVKR